MLAAAEPAGGHRCRLCTAKDEQALIDHVAEQMWESVRGGSLDDYPWATAPAYWRQTYRGLAVRAVASLR